MRRFTITRFTRSATIAAAALSLGAAGCGDDKPGPVATDTTVSTDTPVSTDTTPDGDVAVGIDEMGGEVTVTDPCAPNPCTTAPGLMCDGNSVVTSAGPGTCAANGAAASCTFTEVSVPCDTGEVCSAGACIAAGDACNYEFDTRVSYVTEIKLVASDDCCFDLDGANGGDLAIDNALGDLLSPTSVIGGLLANLSPPFDINDTLAEQIATGNLVLLLETKNLKNLTTDTDVTVNGFYGTDADADLTNNATGMSSFVAYQSAFVDGTSSPYISFMGGTVASGVLKAGPSLFNLTIPLLGASLALAVEATSFEAEISEGALGADGGVAMGGTMGAKLGGYIAMQSVADAFNTYLNTSCSCISRKVDADPYVGIASNSTVTEAKLVLNLKDGSACTAPEQDTCKTIADQLGGAIGGLLPNVLKPDIARNGIYKDAISVGVRIKAVSANVTGVENCETAQ